ncbi:MAG TPA: RecX family transcriptional regulator, partial [Candidatus Contendobacter sp.]|nr:RecX family transcriptional regulator [Candidatus Contendobacter sp.]
EDQVAATLATLEDDWSAKLRDLHRKRFKSHVPADAAGRLQQTRVLRQHGFTLEQIKRLFEGGEQ